MHIQYNNLSDLSKFAAELIIDKFKLNLCNNRKFNFCTTGGKTIKHIYNHLFLAKLDWSKCNIILSDERLVNYKSEFSNEFELVRTLEEYDICKNIVYKFNRKNWLDDYNEYVTNLDKLDIGIFSMGDDGHIASLFPGNVIKDLNIKENVHFVNNAPSIIKNRITFSYELINKIETKILICNNKNPGEIEKLPYQCINFEYKLFFNDNNNGIQQ